MIVKAWLQGDESDLELLARFLDHGDVQVLQRDDGYYLTAADIDDPPAGSHFYEVAQMHLSTVNGLGRLIDPGFAPVRLSGKYQDGDAVHQVVSPQPAVAHARFGIPTVTVTNPDGTIDPGPPSPWPKRVNAAEAHPAAARVLRIMAGIDGVDWYDLYKIHEIIGHNIGGKTRLVGIGWTTKADDRAFTASADRFDVSGDAARHAVDRHKEPPKQTMTINQGRAYISSLVTKWLDHLTST